MDSERIQKLEELAVSQAAAIESQRAEIRKLSLQLAEFQHSVAMRERLQNDFFTGSLKLLASTIALIVDELIENSPHGMDSSGLDRIRQVMSGQTAFFREDAEILGRTLGAEDQLEALLADLRTQLGFDGTETKS